MALHQVHQVVQKPTVLIGNIEIMRVKSCLKLHVPRALN